MQQKAVEVIEKITIRPEDYTAIKDEIAIPLAFQSLDQLIEKINRRVGYGVVRWKYDPNQVGIRTRLVRELKERGYIYDFCSSLGNPQKYEIFATQKDLEAYEKYQSEENQEEIHLFQKANQVTLAEHDLAAIKHEIAFIEGFEHLYRLVEK
ncbi:MAG: hypothetical protein HWD61_11300 [Parachlamydiaceae bacterium]|nr:MAG: hypothetical protein HWD61_11300 [Parachlamydiaceae bacterium]